MNILLNINNTKDPRGGAHMMHEHKLPLGHNIPPHERKAMLHIEFDENDWTLLKEAFGDEDTAAAAVDIIRGAPLEVQILAVQLINIIKEAA